MSKEGHFANYAEVVLNMLSQASASVMRRGQMDTEDWDLIDYMNSLQEGILEAYSGILQGLHAAHRADMVYSHTNAIMQLVAHVAANSRRSEDLAGAAVGVISDLIVSLGPKVKQAVSQQFVVNLIVKTSQAENEVHSHEYITP